MKVTSKNIIKSFTPYFEKRGFKFIKTPNSVSPGVFFKVLDNDFILMYGFTISNRYEDTFTFEISLFPTLEFGLSLSDLKGNTTDRIAVFLNPSERIKLLPERYRAQGIKDGWWYNLDENSIQNVTETIELIEPRFLASGIWVNLNNSTILKIRLESFNEAIKIAINAKINISSDDDLFIEIVRSVFKDVLSNDAKDQYLTRLVRRIVDQYTYVYNRKPQLRLG